MLVNSKNSTIFVSLLSKQKYKYILVKWVAVFCEGPQNVTKVAKQ